MTVAGRAPHGEVQDDTVQRSPGKHRRERDAGPEGVGEREIRGILANAGSDGPCCTVDCLSLLDGLRSSIMSPHPANIGISSRNSQRILTEPITDPYGIDVGCGEVLSPSVLLDRMAP